MTYRIDFDEPLGNEVRRIAATRLKDAASMVRDQPKGLDVAIHDARKHIKQCRALYRLVASAAKDFQKSENQKLGDIARRLSGLRDASALIDATGYIRGELPPKSDGALLDRLTERLDNRRRSLTKDSDVTARTLSLTETELLAAADAVDRLELPHARRKAATCMARGWEKVAEKAVSTLDTLSMGEGEAFHDLRKRTQERWMHAAVMHDLWPTAMTAIQRQAKDLSDMLGHRQNLAVLLDTVSTSHELVGDAEKDAVRGLVVSRQSVLEQSCKERATELFRNAKPRDGKLIVRLLAML